MGDTTSDENPEPLGDERLTEKDTSYSPASEREMRQRETDAETSAATEDPEVDESTVELLPGTGGPDDQGDVDADPGEIRLPRRDEPR